ncbi:MAG: efflux transporter outer membrane subunit [Desulfovibrio sp.]|uniref:efflux transporter outer membrane subunit n=1 Tax=Desulfovibrio sp. TaxID=885 RepID=UPI0039E6021F
MRITLLIIAPLFVVLLTGCANWHGIKPEAKAIDPSTLAIEQSIRDAGKGQPWPAEDWWVGLHDEQLNKLVEEALQGSPALRLAQARLRKADAIAGISRSRLFPQLDAKATVSDERFTANGLYPASLGGETKTRNNAELVGSYTFDLWGGDEAAYRQALGNAKVAEVDAQAARLELTTAIARTYVALAGEYDQLDIDHDLLRQKTEIQKLSAQLNSAGLGSDIENRQAQAAIAATTAGISVSKERIALLKQTLAVLTGASPDRGASISRPALRLLAPVGLPSEIPAELIGRRPDVVAQRWRVEAAGHGIDAAKAQFYPNINLTAFLGFESIGLNKLFMSNSHIYGVGPAITLPIFDAGRLRGNLKQVTAEQDIQVEQYNATVLSALQDVVGQLTSWKANQAALSDQRVAVRHLSEAYRLAMLRYREGLSNYLTVLSAEGELIDQKRKEAISRNRQYTIAIALTHALGGGVVPQQTVTNP